MKTDELWRPVKITLTAAPKRRFYLGVRPLQGEGAHGHAWCVWWRPHAAGVRTPCFGAMLQWGRTHPR